MALEVRSALSRISKLEGKDYGLPPDLVQRIWAAKERTRGLNPPVDPATCIARGRELRDALREGRMVRA